MEVVDVQTERQLKKAGKKKRPRSLEAWKFPMEFTGTESEADD
jgi:hypothetical protein